MTPRINSASLEPLEMNHYSWCPAGDDRSEDCVCFDESIEDVKADFYSKRGE